jgi:COP9 signalosome complex subunit 1
MIQYCVPYSIIDMHRMASAFNTTTEKLESELIRLIGHKGRIRARIDSHEKVMIKMVYLLMVYGYIFY